jgi:hypothetical protein
MKKVLVNALRLQKYFEAYKDKNKKQEVIEKFTAVWGKSMAEHFLWKYDNAEDLIWAFDSENLQLFIDKF